jgi:hypothetical protein
VISRAVYPRRRGRRLLASVAAFGLVAGTLLAANTVLAVHDTGVFELDGNATTTTSHDWDQVCYQVTHDSRCGTTTGAAAVAASWTSDILDGTTDPFVNNSNATIFTGGGSKDPQDINQWAWKDGAGGLPDKDNLVHSFAARYSLAPSATCPAGTAATCELLYFGSDRFDNSGDAQQGFWFFQNPIGLGTNSIGGGKGFTGVHKNGDLLIISDFSNGGTTSTISVYQWDSTVSGNLKLLQTSSAANCATAGAADQFCGLVNAGTITLPWPFLDKSGTTGNQALNGEFYEGGVNLSLLGLGNECFSSVASETRSSTSTTATLKDFVLGGFGKCVATLSTQVSDAGPVTPGTSVHDTLTITSSNVSHTATGSVEWFLCAAATGACSTGGTDLGSSTLSGSGGTATTDSPNVNTGAGLAPGRYCFRAEWPGDTNFTDGPYSEFGGATGTNECFTV